MSEWAPKRFWTDVSVERTEVGHELRLDGRPVRTPGKAALAMPTGAMAEAAAAEWRAVGERIDPTLMPVTRSANSAVDKVRPQRGAVIEHLAEYGATDLLCYRAEGPEALAAMQAERWDPLLDWAAEAHGARLSPVAGVMPVAQDPGALRNLRAPLERASDFELTALHDLISLPGSIILGLAAADGRGAPEDLWSLSRIDEDWQEGLWGVDEEAAERDRLRLEAYVHAHRFLALARA